MAKEGELSGLDRKAHLIAKISMQNYGDDFTQEDYDFELNLAYKMLEALGVTE